MAKKLFIIVITLLICCGSAFASKVALVVQSSGTAKYSNALKGIESVLEHKIRSVVLTTPDLVDIKKEIERKSPDLIIAIGQDALQFVKSVDHIPVAYLFVTNPGIVNGRKNFFGVTLNLKPSLLFDVINDLLPLVKKIGFIYNPLIVQNMEKEILPVAGKKGFSIIFKPADTSAEVAPILFKLMNKVDAVCLYPDVSLMTPESVEHLLLFSLENQVPIISCESTFVFNGASISIDVDEYHSGRMVGLMAKKVLSGEKLVSKHVDPERVSAKLNSRLIRMIDIEIDADGKRKYGN